jgi:hypothetical protein
MRVLRIATEIDHMTDKMNINEATAKDVESLPFMNTERARLVTDYIASNGPLNSIDEVDNIPGIGDKLAGLLAQHFDVGSGSQGNNNQGNNRGGSNNPSGRSGNQGGGGNHGNANK